MKKIYPNKIINLPDTPALDNQYCFLVPKNPRYKRKLDMAQLLEAHKNTTLDYSTDPKLWNEVYSPKKELEIFLELAEKAVTSGEKIHIENVSLAEILEYIEKLYTKL
jgi:hypothetical protein